MAGQRLRRDGREFFGVANGLKPDRFGWLTPVNVKAAEPVTAWEARGTGVALASPGCRAFACLPGLFLPVTKLVLHRQAQQASFLDATEEAAKWKTLGSWNRRGSAVTANGFFTILKSTGWFPTFRLPDGDRYILSPENPSQIPSASYHRPWSPASSVSNPAASTPHLCAESTLTPSRQIDSSRVSLRGVLLGHNADDSPQVARSPTRR